MIHPLLQHFKVRLIIDPVLHIEWDLLGHIQHPVLFITGSPDEVDCLPSQEDLMSQVIGQEGRDHIILQNVHLILSSSGVHAHEERIVQLSLYHPSFDHGEEGSRDLLQDPLYEVLCARCSIVNITVNSTADLPTFQSLGGVYYNCQPLHPLSWLLDPQVKFPEVEVVGRVIIFK